MRQYLLTLNNSQLPDVAKTEVVSWTSENPCALQILKLLDICITASTSNDVLSYLHDALRIKLDDEKLSYQELIKKAIWRINQC